MEELTDFMNGKINKFIFASFRALLSYLHVILGHLSIPFRCHKIYVGCHIFQNKPECIRIFFQFFF